QRAVRGDDGVLRLDPVGQLGDVVVEDDLLHARVERDGLELAEAAGVHGLDDHEALDRVGLEAPGLGEPKLVRVEAYELADVAVEDARQHRRRARIEAPRSEQRPERVEVRIDVRCDDLFCPHRHIVTRAAALSRTAVSGVRPLSWPGETRPFRTLSRWPRLPRARRPAIRRRK